MFKTNALAMRQNLGKVLRQLSRTGKPVLVEQNRKPAAVLISLEDYRKRFVDYEADVKREEVVNRIKNSRIRLPEGTSTLDLIRELRQA